MVSLAGSSSGVPGVSRNITEVFLRFRSLAQEDFAFRNKKLHRIVNEEEMSLVSLEEGNEHAESHYNQPIWIHTSDEVEYEIGKIKNRIDELSATQKKHLSRTSFGDDAVEQAEERRIEGLTDEITKMLNHSQRLITLIRQERPRKEGQSECRLRENVISALLFSLSNITNEFRLHQTSYLGRIRKRAQNVDDYLIAGLSPSGTAEINLLDSVPDQEYSMEQLTMIMNNDSMVKEREKEVLAVNNSIVELNSLFKDLSTMVVEQGTILDRIDHNVENTSIRVTKATESVQSAYRAQKADKKMHCIMCLVVSIVIVVVLIIATKF